MAIKLPEKIKIPKKFNFPEKLNLSKKFNLLKKEKNDDEKKEAKPRVKTKKRIAQANSEATLEEQRNMICKHLNFATSEAYKLLRANLLFTLPDNKCKIVGITSSTRGEGKSMTAINLSYTIAQAKKKVLLIDADMRIPSIAKRLDKKKAPGLSNILAGQAIATISVQPSGVIRGFDVITAGDIPPNPSELLSSPMMDKILDDLSEYYDFIIIDLPPVNIVSDAIVISSRINGLIVVVREDYTSQIELREAVGKLEFLESKILGFCINDVDSGSGNYSRYRGHRYKKYYKYGGYRGYKKYGYGYKKYGYGYKYYRENPENKEQINKVEQEAAKPENK